MATANINLPDGTKVVVEGSPEEVARVLQLIRGAAAPVASAPGGRALELAQRGNNRRGRASPSVRASTGVMGYVRELIAEGFFTERRSITDVRQRLEDLGHIYPVTHLSTPLRRLVVSRELRRLRQGKNWIYVAAT